MKRHLFYLLLIATTAIFNSCQKEVSFENSDTPSQGLLQSDISGECAPMTVFGIYKAGTPLVGTANYIDVTVDVLTLGSYTIYSDTLNGMYFRATGTFTTTGLNTIRLPGTGTPTAAGIHNFVITYGLSACAIDVATLPAGATSAVFDFDGAPGTCFDFEVQGTYTPGVAMTAANKVIINVDVTTIGSYSFTTTPSNGITFSGSGVLATTGPNTITLVASGAPAAAGTMNVSLSVSPPPSTCSFQIDIVGPAAFTINCGTAVPSGTFVKGVSAVGNSVDVQVNVTAIGTYTISGSADGVSFTKTASFTATGNQTITLPASGTPTNEGSFNVTLSGGTGTCSFPLTVIPGATGPAAYAVNCGSVVPHGTFTQGVSVAGNSADVTVNVTTPGSYTITGTANNMTFTKTGVFAAAGSVTVTLLATGTPATAGATSVPLTGGTPTCSINITVAPGAGSTAVFTFDCTSADVVGDYMATVALVPANNYVDFAVNVTTAGTYNISGTVNGMTFQKSGTFAVGPQTVRLAGTGTPTTAGSFNVNLTGLPAPGCAFDVTVDPVAIHGTWSFTDASGTHSGTISDGGFDTIDPGAPFPIWGIFFFIGDNPAGEELEIDFLDVSNTFNSGENYNMATFSGAQNTGGFYFTGIPPKEYNADPDPANAGNTMVARITNHNTTTKTITGTFNGKAVDENGVLKDITVGTFTVTYP